MITRLRFYPGHGGQTLDMHRLVSSAAPWAHMEKLSRRALLEGPPRLSDGEHQGVHQQLSVSYRDAVSTPQRPVCLPGSLRGLKVLVA